MIDINELRRLTQAATPGPWHATKSVETNSWAVWSDTTRLMELRPTKTVDMYRVSNTAAFIAAANPAAISELLDRLEAAEKECDALRTNVEAIERQEPVANVRVHQTGGNAGVAWSAQPLNDFDSLPPLRDGDKLYVLPGAKGE